MWATFHGLYLGAYLQGDESAPPAWSNGALRKARPPHLQRLEFCRGLRHPQQNCYTHAFAVAPDPPCAGDGIEGVCDTAGREESEG